MADIDASNEWLIGKMGENLDDAEEELVFGDDEKLTWGLVETAAGFREPIKATRSQSKAKATMVELDEEIEFEDDEFNGEEDVSDERETQYEDEDEYQSLDDE